MAPVQGTTIRCTGTFRDLLDLDDDGNPQPADPTAVSVRIRDPLGAITEPDVVRDGEGVYHADVDTTAAAGRWVCQFDADGSHQVTAWIRFTIDEAI